MGDRTISAPQLLHEFLSYYTSKEHDGEFLFTAVDIKQHFTDLLSAQPTIETEPVKHGRWKKWGSEYLCSECRLANQFEKPYCPNCGAKMSEVIENE